MNFQNSNEIKKVIDNSKNVLLAFHQSPDPDSIVSNLLMRRYLEKSGIKNTIVCFDKVPSRFKEIYGLDFVIDEQNPETFDTKSFDLFLALDVNQSHRFGFISKPNFKGVINIDHHFTDNEFDGLKINDSTFSSTTEMLFYLLEDFEYKLSIEELNYVLLGIVTDTNSFSYGASSRVFSTVARLIEMGADYGVVDTTIYRNNSIDQLRFWGEGLKKLKVDKKNKFSYVALDLRTINKYPDILQGTRTLADQFARTVSGTNFCLVMSESKEGFLKISVRSRATGFGVIDLLKSLNGGGHFDGGGGRIDLPYKKAVKEALRIARKFAKSKLQENEKSI